MTAMAADDKPAISIVLFNTEPSNMFKWERWSEATVRVKNETAKEETARIVVQFPTVTDNLQTSFTRMVRMPAKSQQEVKMMLRFPSSFSMPRGGPKGFPVRVRLMKNAIVLMEETFYTIPISEERFAVLWCDLPETSLGFRVKKAKEDPSAPPVDPAAGKPASSLPAWARTRQDFSLNTSTAEKMPHHVAGYDAYDVVVLAGWEDQGLDALQTESLLNWVRRGGQLVCIAGTHWMQHANPDLAAALPIWPSERYMVSTLPEVESAIGSMNIADGIPVMDGPRAAGEILIGNEDQPLLMRRACGLGNVYFCALDVDRKAEALSPGMQKFFQSVLGLASEAATAAPLYEASSSRNILEQLIAVKIVSREMMAVWMGGYFLVLVAGLAMARMGRHPALGYGVVAAAAFGGFIFLQVESHLQRAKSVGGVEQVSVYRADARQGGGDVRLTGLMGFFPSSPRNLNFVMQSFDATIGMAGGFGGDRPEVVEFQTKDLTGIGSWQLAPNSLRAVNFDAYVHLPKGALQYKGRLTRDGLLLEAQSGLPWKLSHSFLKWNRFVTPLSDLEAGKEMKIETWKEKSSWGRYQSGNIQGATSLARGMLRQVIFPDALRTMAGNQSNLQGMIQAIHGNTTLPIAVGGFTDQSPDLTQKTADAGTQAALGIWTVAGGQSLLTSDPEFFLPPGMMEMKFAQKEAMISYMGGGNFSGSREDSVRTKFVLPACLRNAVADEIVLQGKFDSLYFGPKPEVGFGTLNTEPREWIPLKWAATMTVPNPQQAFAEGRDTVWVRVQIDRVESAGGPAASADGMGSLSQHWSLENLDVSVRGKLK